MSVRNVAVALLASNTLFREGLAKIIISENYRILCCSNLFDDADLEIMAEVGDVLLIVHTDKDLLVRLSFIERFKRLCPSGRIIMLNDHFRVDEARAAFETGVNAYLVHVATCDAFLKMVELVLMGETIIPSELLPTLLGSLDRPSATSAIQSDSEVETLSPPTPSDDCYFTDQQTQVLRYLVQGDSNKVIARKVRAAEGTVKVHVKAILRKINVANRTQAAVWALNYLPEADPPLQSSSTND